MYTILKIFIFLSIFTTFLINNSAFIANVITNQQTIGNQSPAINAKRDATVNYIMGSESESKIIDKLTEIAHKCKDPKSKFEDIKPDLESLVLYKSKALPLILSFAANYHNQQFDKSDPLFLEKYRKETFETSLSKHLFYVIAKIYLTDSNSCNYIHNLYLIDYLSGINENEALLFAYYIWRLPYIDRINILSNILKDNQVKEWDPIKKVLLRAYLFDNYKEKYCLTSVNEVEQETNSDIYIANLSKVLGVNQMQNYEKFLIHLSGETYISLQDKGLSKDIIAMSYPEIKNKLGGPRGIYLYGFDFFDIETCNLTIDNVLLGKTVFEKTVLSNCFINKTTVLESKFNDSYIIANYFIDTNFIGCDFDGATISWRSLGNKSIIKNCIFSDTHMSGTHLDDAVIVDTQFEECLINNSKLVFSSGLMLNVGFIKCDINKIVFDNVYIDEKTLVSISQLPSFNKSNYLIKKINFDKDPDNNDFADKFGRYEFFINLEIISKIKNEKYYDLKQAIFNENNIYSIKSRG